jgi:hypothetical protein
MTLCNIHKPFTSKRNEKQNITIDIKYSITKITQYSFSTTNSMLILFYKTHTTQSVIRLTAKVKQNGYECNDGTLAIYRDKTA